MCAGPAFAIGNADTGASSCAAPGLHLGQLGHPKGLSVHGRADQGNRACAARPSSRATACTPSPFATARSWQRPATPGSSPSCARRRSRSRRCRSRARVRGPRRARPRDRVRLAPRRTPSSSRLCDALLAQGAGDRGRPRVRLRGEPPSRLKHNCSGKHAGMLALCRAQGWPYEGYRLASHPCSRPCSPRSPSAAETTDEIPTAVDGCGVVTFALPLERMAARSRGSSSRRGGSSAAMRALPGADPRPGRARTRLSCRRVPAGPPRAAPRGSLCAAGPDGPRVRAQGRGRRQPRAPPRGSAPFLARSALDAPALAAAAASTNSRDEVVGRASTMSWLKKFLPQLLGYLLVSGRER